MSDKKNLPIPNNFLGIDAARNNFISLSGQDFVDYAIELAKEAESSLQKVIDNISELDKNEIENASQYMKMLNSKCEAAKSIISSPDVSTEEKAQYFNEISQTILEAKEYDEKTREMISDRKTELKEEIVENKNQVEKKQNNVVKVLGIVVGVQVLLAFGKWCFDTFRKIS